MRQTDDIAPLVDIAEAEFHRLHDEALAALHRLERFWEKLYGPSEGLTQALEDVGALWDTFHDVGDDAEKSRAASRLEYLRGELRAERISYGELAELQSLTEFIDPGDVELLEAAGVPEEDA